MPSPRCLLVLCWIVRARGVQCLQPWFWLRFPFPWQAWHQTSRSLSLVVHWAVWLVALHGLGQSKLLGVAGDQHGLEIYFLVPAMRVALAWVPYLRLRLLGCCQMRLGGGAPFSLLLRFLLCLHPLHSWSSAMDLMLHKTMIQRCSKACCHRQLCCHKFLVHHGFGAWLCSWQDLTHHSRLSQEFGLLLFLRQHVTGQHQRRLMQ
mmetsp:Transcript_60185/g.116062  ORF Transcript_60185/g.116062 Transcript_60185/m.116062 type:complete len:205 (+) Transcript_60185:267-881(+)